MADFILYKKDRLDSGRFERAKQSLARQCSPNQSLSPDHVDFDSYAVLFFDNSSATGPDLFRAENGDFCGVSGCMIYKGQMGKAALGALLEDFDPDIYQPEDFSGIFTVILAKGGRLFLLTDPLGASRVFHSQDQNFWSSSFLATCESREKLTPCAQAIYEYAFQESFYAQDTPFSEIKMADSLMQYEFTATAIRPIHKNTSFDFTPSRKSCDTLVRECADLLRAHCKDLIAVFDNKIKTALSGGYDSRLMLALLKEGGAEPGVYVYGADNSPDVRVARTIAAGEDFPLNHINKGKYPEPTTSEYKKIVEDNFYGLDGLPGESIFDFGANMATRRDRAAADTLILNGGGGEIFRNFFYLPQSPWPGGSYKVRDLINSFYNRYTVDFCQDIFCEKTYRENLAEKIRYALELKGDKLSRTQVEYAYPAFRLRHWTSRDNSNNTRLGPYITPFISYTIIKKALTIPLKYKNHGQFQADLIKEISPALAHYTSDYGYAFDQPPPLKARIKNYLTLWRPAWLRRYSYALQHKMKKLDLPKSMQPEFIQDIIDPNLPHMCRYFKVEHIRDAGLLARLYTLEYLFDHFKRRF